MEVVRFLSGHWGNCLLNIWKANPEKYTKETYSTLSAYMLDVMLKEFYRIHPDKTPKLVTYEGGWGLVVDDS